MTQKDKKLLLKDLSARLPYGVLFMVHSDEINEPVELLSINPKRDKPLEIDDGHDENSSTYRNLEEAKPYLRPLSSMTEEEREEYDGLLMSVNDGCENTDYMPYNCMKYVDWLNAHHFDHRGLIPMGLALEAPENMYKDE